MHIIYSLNIIFNVQISYNTKYAYLFEINIKLKVQKNTLNVSCAKSLLAVVIL